MPRLSVNVNKIALLRNSRNGNVPCVLDAAATAIEAGAHGITVHPRPDQRHIRPRDCDDLRALIDTAPGGARVELNIEGNPLDLSRGDHLMALLHRVRPDQATLVPDHPDQATSDHGWDLRTAGDDLLPIIDQLHTIGCRVSLFMDPDPDQIQLVPATGADRIELYTESYARAFAVGGPAADRALATYRRAAGAACDLGLGVNAGHDLNLANLPPFVRIPRIAEVSIGHALIADALAMGLAPAVRAYLAACHGD